MGWSGVKWGASLSCGATHAKLLRRVERLEVLDLQDAPAPGDDPTRSVVLPPRYFPPDRRLLLDVGRIARLRLPYAFGEDGGPDLRGRTSDALL